MATDQELFLALEIIKKEMSLLSGSMASLHRKADQIIMSQSDADALAQRIDADVQAEAAALTTVVAGIQELKDELAAAQQQNPAVDLSGIAQKVANLDETVTEMQAVAGGVPQPPQS